MRTRTTSVDLSHSKKLGSDRILADLTNFARMPLYGIKFFIAKNMIFTFLYILKKCNKFITCLIAHFYYLIFTYEIVTILHNRSIHCDFSRLTIFP